jgi:hypothetical protein
MDWRKRLVMKHIFNIKTVVLASILFFCVLLFLGRAGFFIKPKIENPGSLGADEIKLFLNFLKHEGNYIGDNQIASILKRNRVDRIYFSKSIVDDGAESGLTSSMRIWFKGVDNPERYLLLKGKVVKVKQGLSIY